MKYLYEHTKLLDEFQISKNKSIDPKKIKLGSGKKVWWKCSKGHEWITGINHRSNGTGCPYCSGRNVCEDNCLQTVNPNLAEEWHPTRNGKLTPKDFTPNSNKKVWWKCTKGHEWTTSISHRSNGRGCPFCSGKKVCEDNCLQTVNPNLSEEWHPNKNGKLTPRDVTKGSDKRVWWICSKKHEWEATIYNRNSGKGCPYCYGLRKFIKKD